MTAFDKALEIIKKFEHFRSKAYPDPLHGWKVPTIGYGTTMYPSGRKVARGDVCSKEMALGFLRWHMRNVLQPKLERIPTWRHMNDNQRAAIYSITYNLKNGANFYGARDRASLTRLVDSPSSWNDRDEVIRVFELYRNPGSKVEKGLRRRRRAEAELFLGKE